MPAAAPHQTQPRKQNSSTTQSNLAPNIWAYASISLVAGLIAIALLLLYVYKVPQLVDSGSQKQVFYLLLIPWGLAAAAFLFGAMRSYARLTYKQVGTTLELGGPVVIFCLVIVGGYWLIPQSETFDLTLRAHSDDGTVPVITSGSFTVELGQMRYPLALGPSGEADLKGIQMKFKGANVRVLPDVEGFKKEWQSQKLNGTVLDLALSKEKPPEDPNIVNVELDGVHWSRVIQPPSGVDFYFNSSIASQTRIRFVWRPPEGDSIYKLGYDAEEGGPIDHISYGTRPEFTQGFQFKGPKGTVITVTMTPTSTIVLDGENWSQVFEPGEMDFRWTVSDAANTRVRFLWHPPQGDPIYLKNYDAEEGGPVNIYYGPRRELRQGFQFRGPKGTQVTITFFPKTR